MEPTIGRPAGVAAAVRRQPAACARSVGRAASSDGVPGGDGRRRPLDVVVGRRRPVAGAVAAEPPGAWSTDPLEPLHTAIDGVVAVDLDELPDLEVTARLAALRRPIARLAAERARLTAELERRATSTADDPAKQAAARRRLRRDLTDQSHASPADTKRDAEAGQIADEHGATGAAFHAGDITADHVRLIGETLAAVVPDMRVEVEDALLEVARRTNTVVFGRHAREVAARHAPQLHDRRASRQNLQRRVRAYDTPDGGFAFSGLLYGLAAETARTALDAFRRPDAVGEHRTPEQRSADAFEQLCDSALRAGEAPTQHGVRPQVLVTIPLDELLRGDTGLARFASGEPISIGKLRTLLADCTWARILLGPDSTPLEASEAVRTVPAGLWRALVARDGGCRWPGCDAPAAWCDVAHGTRAFARGGQLAPDNAALLCRRHHRRFDHSALQIRIDGASVTFHDPSGHPVVRDEAVARAGPDPPAGSGAPAGSAPRNASQPLLPGTGREDHGAPDSDDSPPPEARGP
jgi:hypothetical protein